MLNFASDYTEGCHPKVLEALTRTNMEQLTGYGTDIYSDRAKEKIRAKRKESFYRDYVSALLCEARRLGITKEELKEMLFQER